MKIPTAVRARAGTAALMVCLAGIIIGSRWAVVDRYGSDLPTWDQWDAEGLHLLAPWFGHRLTLAELFRPQNEHRVVLTKVVNLGLTLANGQWDQRLECAVNAFLPAIIAVGLFAIGRSACDRRWRGPLFILLAGVFGLPLAWQNVLGGFHSPQFFLIGLSFAAICWLPTEPAWSFRWWLGAAAAVLALGSLASGFFAAAVVIAILAARHIRRELSHAALAPALVLCAVLVAVGIGTRVSVDYHEAMKAHGAADFFLTAIRCLQWPTSDSRWAWAAGLLWLPWAWLLARYLVGAGGADRKVGAILAGLGGWVLLQILATAFARGAGAPYPASRYIDTLVFGAVVNFLALGWLARQSAPGRGQPITILAWLWVAVFVLGVWGQARRILGTELPSVRNENFYCEENVRHYLASGDETYLHHTEIPYPDAAAFVERVRVPALHALLPVSVRAPLALREAGAAPDGFSRGDRGGLSPATSPLTLRATWGSFGSEGTGATRQWESAPIRGQFGGWLKFEMAGQAGKPGVALELWDRSGGKRIAEVKPSRVPGDAWRSTYVRTPPGEFIVRAIDRDRGTWIAFSEPVEMAPLSYAAWKAVKNGRLLAEFAAAAAALVGAAAAWRSRREPGSFGSQPKA